MNAAPLKMTPKQREAWALMGGTARHILLEGGSRSGKTALICYAIMTRAMKAPGSRHAILRFRFNHLIASMFEDTWPKIMDIAFPGLREQCKTDKAFWFTTFPNKSQVWWGGLDDKERTEKVLGQEHASIYLNECSQISYASRNLAATRLAQNVSQSGEGVTDRALPLRFYYDANPPTRSHWLYRLFHEGVDPVSRAQIRNPANYARLLMNPADNAANLPAEYLEELEALPPHLRRRFYEGLYSDDNPNAIFRREWFDRWRVTSGELPDMQRIVIPVDPSGAGDEDNAGNDAIGIGAVGLGVDGNVYLLEDLTIKAGPDTWGKVAVTAYQRHGADKIVGEKNYGGAMVDYVVRGCASSLGVRVAYQDVTASRGKVVRAEPLATLYEQGRIRHVGDFPELEEEMLGFSTTGYKGTDSPNRADMLVWGVTALFPALSRKLMTPAREVNPMADYAFDDDGYDGVAAWKVA